jgi:mannose/fructose/N-acetylgalactosamine-specific phosphotransferase system component IIB
MPVILARIDDRLIHGQVVVGWCQKLRPDRIVLANDTIAADPWQSRVYGSSVPREISVSILSIVDAAAKLAVGGEFSDETVVLLAGNPMDMDQIIAAGADVDEVNVGGLHFSTGKVEMLPFVYVDRDDLSAMYTLLDRSVTLQAQQVPGGRHYHLNSDEISAMEEKV